AVGATHRGKCSACLSHCIGRIESVDANVADAAWKHFGGDDMPFFALAMPFMSGSSVTKECVLIAQRVEHGVDRFFFVFTAFELAVKLVTPANPVVQPFLIKKMIMNQSPNLIINCFELCCIDG